MEPEEHLIDSLLHEHHRVPGDADTDFLNSLEEKLDEQETEQDCRPQAKKGFSYWVPAAVAAGIVALISISLFNNTRTKDSPLAIELENPSPPPPPGGETELQPYTQPEVEAEASAVVQNEISESLVEEGSTGKASGRAASAKLGDSVRKLPPSESTKTSDRLPDPRPADLYNHELAQAQTLLLEVRQLPLPDQALSLNRAEKESLQLAFTILKTQTRFKRQYLRDPLADEPNEPSFSPTEDPSVIPEPPSRDSTGETQAKRKAKLSSKTAALQLFRKVFAVKPQPRSSASPRGDADPSPTKTVTQALESWEKSLK